MDETLPATRQAPARRPSYPRDLHAPVLVGGIGGVADPRLEGKAAALEIEHHLAAPRKAFDVDPKHGLDEGHRARGQAGAAGKGAGRGQVWRGSRRDLGSGLDLRVGRGEEAGHGGRQRQERHDGPPSERHGSACHGIASMVAITAR